MLSNVRVPEPLPVLRSRLDNLRDSATEFFSQANTLHQTAKLEFESRSDRFDQSCVVAKGRAIHRCRARSGRQASLVLGFTREATILRDFSRKTKSKILTRWRIQRKRPVVTVRFRAVRCM